jgi:hypothetical protein
LPCHGVLESTPSDLDRPNASRYGGGPSSGRQEVVMGSISIFLIGLTGADLMVLEGLNHGECPWVTADSQAEGVSPPLRLPRAPVEPGIDEATLQLPHGRGNWPGPVS